MSDPPADRGTTTPLEPSDTAVDVDSSDDIWITPAEAERLDAEDDDGRPGAAPAGKSTLRNLVEWVVVVGGAVLVAVLIRAFVVQTFWIPSPSMATTLVTDDRVVVNKLSYRLHDVNRGDVIVFRRPPGQPETGIKDLIKRVVGLGGERVSILDGSVRIDGEVLEEPYTNGLETVDNGCSSGELEQLYTPEGLLIPDDHVFVLGDNRVNSGDGRCFGPIDEDLIVGRAFFKIWPPGDLGGL